MSSERELDEGIKSIKSAWRREHTARTNLKRMLEQAEAENAKLVDMLGELYWCSRQLGCDRCTSRECCGMLNRMREMGIRTER